jgi:hypothetical protein
LFNLPLTCAVVIDKDRFDEALVVLQQLHGDKGQEYVYTEYAGIRAQIELERGNQAVASWVDLFTPRFIRRTGTAALLLFSSQIMGVSAIQNYQSLLYAGLGYKGNTVLLISGVYGMMGFIGNVAGTMFVADRWPRVRTLWVGCAILGVLLSALMPISKFYADGHNPDGSRAGVALIFIYSGLNAVFLNGTMYVVAAEIFPLHLRPYGNGIGIFSMSAGQLLFSQVTPLAFSSLHWKYYAIYLPCCFLLAIFFAFYVPETKGKTLEEIAEAFGDKVAAVADTDAKVAEPSEEKTQEEVSLHVEDSKV